MDYRITIDQLPGHLFVNVWGPNTTESIARYSNDVREACIRLRQTRVLIVVNLVGESLSMLDVYRSVSAGSELARDMGMRVAYVDENPERTAGNMILAEDVAATRGIDVRTFRSVADARTWLLAPDETAAVEAGVPLDAC
jgi:hypothetical protein